MLMSMIMPISQILIKKYWKHSFCNQKQEYLLSLPPFQCYIRRPVSGVRQEKEIQGIKFRKEENHFFAIVGKYNWIHRTPPPNRQIHY